MDLKRAYLVSQGFTLLTVVAVIILTEITHDSRTAIFLIIGLFIMLIAGIMNIPIAAKAGLKDIVIYLCFIEFLALFLVFVFYFGFFFIIT